MTHCAPAVSVVIPCYNLGAFVTEAVESVLAQTYKDVEIIVVNDGSTDAETVRVLQTLHRPQTTILTTDNHGLPAARNHGFRHARGRYICALDADDCLEPDFLERTIGRLEADPSLTFVSTWAECFGTEQWLWRQERCDLIALLAECVVLTAAPIRRTALEAVGGYDEVSYLFGCEDWDLWISLTERGYLGTIVPEVLFRYRQRPGSMRRLSEDPRVRQRIWQTLLEKHRDSYVRHAAEVLLLQEVQAGRLLRGNWDLQFEIETVLKPALAARLAGREHPPDAAASPTDDPAAGSLHATLPQHDMGADHQNVAMSKALQDAYGEIAALRSSASWRVTAPLRLAYDKILAVRRRLASPRAGEGEQP
jgi:GT2 family glycosyltransferase